MDGCLTTLVPWTVLLFVRNRVITVLDIPGAKISSARGSKSNWSFFFSATNGSLHYFVKAMAEHMVITKMLNVKCRCSVELGVWEVFALFNAVFFGICCSH